MTRWAPLLATNCRTARELSWCHQQLREEVEEAMVYLEREEVEGVLSVPLEGLGEGCTTCYTRKLLSRAREELRLEVFQQAVILHHNQRARGIRSWKERDNLTTSWLLSTPGPHSSLPSLVLAEARASQRSMPSRVCKDRLGEVVGRTRVDMFGKGLFWKTCREGTGQTGTTLWSRSWLHCASTPEFLQRWSLTASSPISSPSKPSSKSVNARS